MADLEIADETRSLSTGEDVTVIRVSGSIDASTYPSYEKKLSSLCRNGKQRSIIDMGACTYINSTGMGFMVTLANEVRNNEGDIYLTGLSEDVSETMSILGLLDLFNMYDDLDECLKAVSETEPEEFGDEIFPKRIRCSGCNSVLSIASAGKYSCPSCGTYLAAERDGKVRTFRPIDSQTMMSTIPTSFEWWRMLQFSAQVLAKRFEFEESVSKHIMRAVDEIWSAIASKRTDKRETCDLAFIGGPQGIILGFVLYKRKIVDDDPPENSFFVKALSEYSDEVQIKRLAAGGQVLRVVIRSRHASKKTEAVEDDASEKSD